MAGELATRGIHWVTIFLKTKCGITGEEGILEKKTSLFASLSEKVPTKVPTK